jgi:peptidoglycan/LPS O-acetylase OafA/YrhL
MYTGPVIELRTGPIIESASSPIRNLRLDTAPEAAPERFHIPSLDGIRALAFGLVFVAHAWGTHLGMFGVTVFFFLSGFLITTLMRREHELSGSISLSNFYIRRSLRIFPPLYLTIGSILVLVVTRALNERVDTGSFVATSTFITNYWIIFKGLGNSGLGPLWSLSVEEHFYCLFPFLFLLMTRLGLSYKNQSWALGGLCLAFLVWRLLLVFLYSGVPVKYLLYASDTRMDSILFGCILALRANPVLDREGYTSKIWSGLGVSLLLLSFCIRNNNYRITLHYTLQGLALIPIFTLVIYRATDWFRWLNGRAIRFIGSLSYSMYLVHSSFLVAILARVRSHTFAVFLALTLTFLYAYAMNRLVERPLARVRQRIKYARQASSPAEQLCSS